MGITLNPLIDKYLVDGCMRCKYGGTPQCKVLNWREELETLRQIVLEWGVPVYTHQGKNILNVDTGAISSTFRSRNRRKRGSAGLRSLRIGFLRALG
jgi:hypothetical protein